MSSHSFGSFVYLTFFLTFLLTFLEIRVIMNLQLLEMELRKMNRNICNICGANYEYKNGRWLCPACGAYKAEEFSNEEVTLLYNAAQALRLNSFDHAEDLYFDIVRQYPENAIGYWGLVLAKYGIKYETDISGKSIPTCYKSSYEDFRNDLYYKKALLLSASETRQHYIEEAEKIANVCAEWRTEAQQYSYDVFISFKATDENGNETEDLREMQDLYTFLTEKGYKVFFSPVSMRAYVGKSYDAYIFNALDAARVMILYGSRAEYFTSTWMSNEWTRYLRKIDKGEKKSGSLILSYVGISPENLPRQLRHLQALDASKKTFYPDILTAIETIQRNHTSSQPQVYPPPITPQPRSLNKAPKKNPLKRDFLVFLFHAIAFFTFAMLGAIIADIVGVEIEENPISNTCLWIAIFVLFVGGFWAIKTVWTAVKTLFKKLLKH